MKYIDKHRNDSDGIAGEPLMNNNSRPRKIIHKNLISYIIIIIFFVLFFFCMKKYSEQGENDLRQKNFHLEMEKTQYQYSIQHYKDSLQHYKDSLQYLKNTRVKKNNKKITYNFFL